MCMYTKLRMAAVVLVLLVAINWSISGAFKFDMLKKIFPESCVAPFYLLVGVAAVYLLTQRSTYLPFLDRTAVPCALFQDKEPQDATHQIKIQTQPGTRVLYWAAQDSDVYSQPPPMVAYGDVSNSGVTTADSKGMAILKIRKPQPYEVGLRGKMLKPHVHYRECNSNLMLGPVKTAQVKN